MGQVEDIFSDSFIQKYYLPDKIQKTAELEAYRNYKNFRFEDLLCYKSEMPSGWTMPWIPLYTIFKDIEKEEYIKNVKECWKQIGFSEKFSEIMKKVDTVIQNNEKFISVHVRSGDIVYGHFKYAFFYKALAAELAVEVIVRELPHYNVLLSGDDLTSLERIKEFSLQTVKEEDIDCHGHSVILANEIKDNIYIYNDIQLAFYDCYVLSKGEKIFIPRQSAFSLLASYISDTNDIFFCCDYFPKEEQFNSIIKFIEKLHLHPAQRAFSYYHLLELSKKIGKSLEEQFMYADKMVALTDNIGPKAIYSYFLLENNKVDLFNNFINSLSFTELSELLMHILMPGNVCPATPRYLNKIVFKILTPDNGCTYQYFYNILGPLTKYQRNEHNHIYKNIFFRFRVYLYHRIYKIFHRSSFS